MAQDLGHEINQIAQVPDRNSVINCGVFPEKDALDLYMQNQFIPQHVPEM